MLDYVLPIYAELFIENIFFVKRKKNVSHLYETSWDTLYNVIIIFFRS